MVEDNVNIEVVPQIKLLGTLITSDLKWDINTQHLVKRAYGRMQLLHKAAKFTKTKKDLIAIYKTYIRPVLEQSATVWHSSITEENSKDLCRVQKAAVRIIMGSDFVSYSHGLQALDIDPLPLRREKLSLNMAVRTCSTQKRA